MSCEEKPMRKCYEEAEKEYYCSNAFFPETYHSVQEGYAAIKIEMDALWDNIRVSMSSRANDQQLKRVIRIMAQCVKFMESFPEENKLEPPCRDTGGRFGNGTE